jgi:AcrR family transcriptional regulator
VSREAAVAVREEARAKRRQILDGARQVFSHESYERSTVDRIAARARVSKATVYRHYGDKRSLFVAVVVDTCEEMSRDLECGWEEQGEDLEEALRAMGERVVRMSLSSTVIALHRQAITESERIPEIARTVFECGTLAIQQAVAARLRRWAEAGVLEIEDARSAAIAFLALCGGDLVIRARLGVLQLSADEEILSTIRRGTAIFLRAHRR